MEKENEKAEEKEIKVEENEEIEKKEEIKQEEVKEQKETKNADKEKKIKEKEEVIAEQTEIEEKKSKKGIVILTVLIIVVLFISTIFAIMNLNNSNIIKGVYIEETNLSNLSKEEVKSIITEKISKIEDIELSYKEYSTTLKLKDVGIEIDEKTSIEKAISIGKTNNILIDNYSILKANFLKTKIPLNINIKEEKLEKTIKNILAEMPEAVKEYSYEIEDDKLIITKGTAGQSINKETFKEKLLENIKIQFNGMVNIIDIPTEYAEPQKIDIEKIYNEIYKEAKDAYIIEEPFELYKEENGIDFDITMEEAKKLLEEDKQKYIIPLKITEPKFKVKDLGDKLFKQTLSKYTTIYDAGNYNRSNNIQVAARTINGTILLPGETFSYDATIGNTTKEKGYKTGGAYVGGKVVQVYGGGICQVSSTLYNAVLYANLEIVERHNHSYAVNYVPAGRDATISSGGKDFKFKNTRSYPVKIVASAKNGVVSISLKGIKEEKEYEVVLTSTVLSTTPNSTTYQDNSNLEEGKEKVIQKGYVGKKSIAYKILKYNGKIISKTVLSKDTYKPMNKIIERGTKKTANVTTTTTTTTTTTQPTGTPSTTTPTVTTPITNTITTN